MSTTLPANSSMIEGRVRRSRGSLERQTTQSQPSVGTPMDVPLPSTVSVAFMREPSGLNLYAEASSSAGSRGRSRLRRARQGVGHFHIGHTHFVEAVLQKVFFGRGQVALGLFRNQRESIDGLPSAKNVNPRLLPLLVHQPHLQHSCHVERRQEALESHLKLFGRASAQLNSRIQFLRGFPVSVGLRLLFSSGGRCWYTLPQHSISLRRKTRHGVAGRRVFLGSGRSRRRRSHHRRRFCLFGNIFAQLSV